MTQRIYPCTQTYQVQQCRQNLLKDHPFGDSTVTGWSSANETLGQDTMISPPLSHGICREVVPNQQGHNSGQCDGICQGRIHGVGLLLINKSSKLSMFVSNNWYACILCSILNKEVHRHSTVKIES